MEVRSETLVEPDANDVLDKQLDPKCSVVEVDLKKDAVTILNLLTEKCSICLDFMKLGNRLELLQCCHLFHYACIETWMKKHFSCPICRALVKKQCKENFRRIVQQMRNLAFA